MTIPLKIIKSPNIILNKVCKPFDFDNPIMDPKVLEEVMVETMYLNGGMGLAAPQVGLDARVFVMGARGEAMALFNPVILEVSDETIMDVEGCLSFPGVKLHIHRPNYVHIEFQDRDQKTHQFYVKDYDCRCIIHEIEHLDGITFNTKVSKFKWDLATRRKKHKN